VAGLLSNRQSYALLQLVDVEPVAMVLSPDGRILVSTSETMDAIATEGFRGAEGLSLDADARGRMFAAATLQAAIAGDRRP
jgi:hypothetical protein